MRSAQGEPCYTSAHDEAIAPRAHNDSLCAPAEDRKRPPRRLITACGVYLPGARCSTTIMLEEAVLGKPSRLHPIA